MHLFRDSFQNYKVYQIPKAQLIIADVPYNLGVNAYGSSPSWYVGGITRMAKAIKRARNFLIRKMNLGPPNSCTFVLKCL